MANALIVTLPAHGHVNPTVSLAQRLVAQGEEVTYCLPNQYRRSVEPSGAAFVPYTVTGRQFRWSAVPCEELFVSLPLHAAISSLEILPQLLESARKVRPDYVIYDAWCLWARLLAHILHLPAIRCQPTFVLDEHLGPAFWTMIERAGRLTMPRVYNAGSSEVEQQVTFADSIDELRSIYHVPLIDLKSFYDHAEALNLLPIPRAFQPGGESFDARFQFVGPAVRPDDEALGFPLNQLTETRPVLYISLGTVCNDEKRFYEMCFEAFGEGGAPRVGKGPSSGRARTRPDRPGKSSWRAVSTT
jgi:MGT family glycosyltransferase